MFIRYALHVFFIRMIKLDPYFEPLPCGLDRMHILLNNTGQGNHVPEAERSMRTTKDSSCAGFYRTPFKKLPVALTISLVHVVIFWDNSVSAEDGVSRSISPEGIITGRSLNLHKNYQIRFGSYVQTAKEGDNTIAT